jgi:glycerol-3-phosphate acyltransferase PlsX
VIVCDGFTGNIALKSSEGLVRLILKTARERYRGFLALPVLMILKAVMSKLYPDEYNGARLLGLQGLVIKSHGSARVKATTNAIIRAQYEARTGESDQFLELLGKNIF